MHNRHRIVTVLLFVALVYVLYSLWIMSVTRNNLIQTLDHDWVDGKSNMNSDKEKYRHKQVQDLKKHGQVEEKLRAPIKYSTSLMTSLPLHTQTLKHCEDEDGNYIPNIVHFLWLHETSTQLLFTEMISIRSTHEKQRPEKIVIHCITRPEGRWWQEVEEKVPKVELKFLNITRISRNVKSTAVMLSILKEYGGIIAMTMDVIFIQSLDSLRHYEFVMARSKLQRFVPSIVMSCKHSKFLHIYAQQFNMLLTDGTMNTKPDDYSIAVLPYELSLRYKQYIYVETNEKISRPTHTAFLSSSNGYMYNWKDCYTLDLQFDHKENRLYDPGYIKTLRNVIGQVLRYIYYGSADERSPFAPWILYSTVPVAH